MAIHGLIILSGAVPGIRDLMWVNDPDPEVVGYIPFRSEDSRSSWSALATNPVPGSRYRDMTTLESHTYLVQDSDWLDRGSLGTYVFKVPITPIFGSVVGGRALVASQPQDVEVTLNGAFLLAARVDGVDGTIWLPTGEYLQSNGDWKAPDAPLAVPGSEVMVTYKALANFVDPTPERRAYYTVVPMLSNGQLAHQPGAPGTEVINILEVDKMDYMQAEMVRRNAWLFEQTGEPSHLLLRRTKGVNCGCKVEGQARTGCEACYETGIVGGYYGPYDLLFIDPDVGASRELDEGGVKVTRQSKSYLGPTPVLQPGDLILRKNGERLVIGPVTYVSPRGVLLQQEFDVMVLPSGDTRYRVPLRPPVVPVIYDPRFQPPPPDAGGEPIVDPRGNPPNKPWENRKVPLGRTVVFGNITT